jgi:energy-coupling factor transporter ATP-binding protein EcfA2
MRIFTDIEILNFRGILHGKIKLGKMNIITGASESGKTTILDAIYLLCNYVDSPLGNPIAIVSRNHTIDVKEFFRYYNTRIPVELKANRGQRRVMITTREGIKSKDRQIPVLYLRDDRIREYLEFLEANIHDIHYRVNFDYINERYSCTDKELYIHEKGGKRVIRLYHASSTVQKYVVAYLLYKYLHPKVLLWDNVDVTFGKWLTSIDSQVIVSVQNPDLAEEVEGIHKNIMLRHDGKLLVV